MSDETRLERQLAAERRERSRRQPSTWDQGARWAEEDTEVPGLWANARKKPGRPPGVTNIVSDLVLWDAMRATRVANRRLTAKNVATTGGTFSLGDLRGYLRATGRKWVDVRDEFLRTF